MPGLAKATRLSLFSCVRLACFAFHYLSAIKVCCEFKKKLRFPITITKELFDEIHILEGS
jgi:hypothetical protein